MFLVTSFVRNKYINNNKYLIYKSKLINANVLILTHFYNIFKLLLLLYLLF